jgi:hypothetical protein
VKSLPPTIEISLCDQWLDHVPESCRELVAGIVTSALNPDLVFRELLAPHLAQMTAQVRPWCHGQLTYQSTESWRTAYQAVLTDSDIQEYRSVAWVKTEDYWQDLPGQRAMQFNYALVDRGVIIERQLILGWNLWPPEVALPHPIIRTWIEEQHYRGIEIGLVREADLVGEPGLLGDFGIYGDRATGKQELDDASRTVCFTLSFDRAAVQVAQEQWAKLALFATPYAALLDHNFSR